MWPFGAPLTCAVTVPAVAVAAAPTAPTTTTTAVAHEEGQGLLLDSAVLSVDSAECFMVGKNGAEDDSADGVNDETLALVLPVATE